MTMQILHQIILQIPQMIGNIDAEQARQVVLSGTDEGEGNRYTPCSH